MDFRLSLVQQRGEEAVPRSCLEHRKITERFLVTVSCYFETMPCNYYILFVFKALILEVGSETETTYSSESLTCHLCSTRFLPAV